MLKKECKKKTIRKRLAALLCAAVALTAMPIPDTAFAGEAYDKKPYSLTSKTRTAAKVRTYVDTDGLVWTDSYYFGYETAPEDYFQNVTNGIYVAFNLANNIMDSNKQYREEVKPDGTGYAELREVDEPRGDKPLEKTEFSYADEKGSVIVPTTKMKEEERYAIRIYLPKKDSGWYSRTTLVDVMKWQDVVWFRSYLRTCDQSHGKMGTKKNVNAYTAFLKRIERLKPEYYLKEYIKVGDGDGNARTLAKKLVKNCRNDYEKVTTVAKWINSNIAYGTPDWDFRCPDLTLFHKKGVCHDFSMLLRAMLNAVGIPCIYVSSVAQNHAWNLAYVAGRWISLDSTWRDIGDNLYYEAATHIWTDAEFDDWYCPHDRKTTIKKATPSRDGSENWECTICGAYGGYIIHRPQALWFAKPTTSSKSYVYDGKVKKPSVLVKDRWNDTISSSNYRVSYSKGCKNVGRYTVKVTFKGNYTGSLTKSFTIRPKGTTISKLSAGKKKLTVKWKKQTRQTTGYQLQYSTNKKFKSGNKTVTIGKNKTASKKLSRLKAKKRYYVRIRTYKTIKVNGKSTRLYSTWSKAKSIKVK